MSTRKSFTIQEKAEVIRLLETGESNRSVGKKFKMSSSTISTIWKGRDVIKQVFESNPAAKKLRPCNDVLIDEALLKWLKIQMSNNIEVTTTTLQENARKCALEIGIDDFQCTRSWIQRFRKRYKSILLRTNETMNTLELSVNWLSTVWPSLRKEYMDDEIYNAVEQSCLFGFSSNRTYVLSNETNPQVRGDFSKERLTILIGANMTGTDKLKPYVVGKSDESDLKHFPVDYEYHPKGSINSNVFEKIIRNWDELFYQQKKKILLLVDKRSMNLEIDNLKAIELVFLPTNIKSPLKTNKKSSETSIIITIKNEFRTLEIKKLLEDFDKTTTPKQINIVEACVMISTVWNNISQNLILNSFISGGFNDEIKFEKSSDDHLPLEVCLSSLTNDNLIEEKNKIVVKEEENEITVTENQIISENGIKIEDVAATLDDAAFAVRTLRKYFIFNQGFDCDKTKSAISHLEHLIESQLLNRM